MQSPQSADVVHLVRRLAHYEYPRRIALIAAALFLPAVVLLAFFMLGHADALVAALQTAFATMWQRPTQALWTLTAIPLGALYFAHFFFSQKYERLEISDAGLEYRYRLPGWLAPLSFAWRAPWSRLRGAELVTLRGRQPLLTLSDGTKKLRLVVFNWIVPEQPFPIPNVTALLKPSAAAVQAAVDASPLIRALIARGVSIRYPERTDGLYYDLFSNRHALVAVILLFASGLYGLTDLIVIEEQYVGDPVAIFIALGSACGVLAYYWLHRARLPTLHTVVIALMLAGTAGLASAPILLRINRVTNTAVAHEYVLTAYTHLVPLEHGLPEIDFPHNREYWEHIPLNTIVTIELRRGAFGFYQINLSPLYATMRAFYEERDPTPKHPPRKSIDVRLFGDRPRHAG